MATKQKLEKGVTPKGVASYPHLVSPDEYKGKLSYKVNLRIGAEESVVLRKKIEEATARAQQNTIELLEEKAKSGKTGADKAKAKKQLASLTTTLPYSESVDDEGNEDGDFIFKFKANASYRNKNGDDVPVVIPIFDASEKCLNPSKKKAASIQIWGGSVLKVSYSLVPYFVDAVGTCGVSLRINGVQVIELVSGSGGSAKSYGFGSEDGYTQADDGDDDDAADGDEGGCPSHDVAYEGADF
jgi:hypothetical protein